MLMSLLGWQRRLAIAAIFFQSTYAFAGQLKIDIEGVTPGEGVVLVAIFPEAAASSFPIVKNENGIKLLSLDGNKQPLSTTVTLPNGNYAISAFEDRNHDGALALNGPYGSPSEPWGLSNNRKPRNRGPIFGDAVFSVGDGQNTQKIRLGL
ncbi:DUF2141 domain-containing protein [Trinickia dinghuensis]|uniref:DUF2141 domain-containing protein n=1 Tax=Trinickia dinghuensis TaxID=2291023 RepID=A0A3D8JNH2_9BURK|nr:DUF2141 domain-containing protein [Trinickia dinghuensis]RDU94558.1 DUF2141 domain-containing protein [Trinickia dinghuensis]